MKTLSTIEYIMDPRFEVLGLASLRMMPGTIGPGYESRTSWQDGEDGVQEMLSRMKVQYGEHFQNCTIVAHNAKFDVSVLAFKYHIYPAYVIDTLGLARHWNARRNNDLASLAKHFGLPDKGDTKLFTGFTNRVRAANKGKRKGPPVKMPRMTEQDKRDLGVYAQNDVAREWELLKILLPKLSNPKTELRIMHHTLELFYKPTLKVDYNRAEDIKARMNAEIDREIDKANEIGSFKHPVISRSALSGETSFERLLLDALNGAGDDYQKYTKRTKKKNKAWMFALAKDDPARDQLLTHPDPWVRSLMEARVALKSWPLHIKRVDRIVNQSKATGGWLPVPLKYCGAHTGRWSGGEKINLQNLGSRGHELVNAIRGMLIADDGDELIIADSAQIEARVLPWLANQNDLVEKFANNEKIYCEFASKILGFKVRKPRKDGPIKAIEDKMKWARNSVGKVGVLACGYGMGPERAVDYANGTIDLETATKVVKTYRADNKRVVKFWSDIERAFIYTARYGKPCSLDHGLTLYQLPDCDVVIRLPNGRELKYHQVKVRSSENGKATVEVYNALEKCWKYTWGGSLTENIVQAISRDILWGAIELLEDDGVHVAHHVHDELIAVVPHGDGELALHKAITALSITPKWARGLPLSAEGVVTRRYGDH